MGWSLIAVVVILLTANIAIMLYVLGKEAIKKLKVRYYTRRNKRLIAERRYKTEEVDDRQGGQTEL